MLHLVEMICLWGDCGIVHGLETKGAEAEMKACPCEVFGGTSLERDGANRKVGDTSCPVEPFMDSKCTVCTDNISFRPVAGIH